MSIALLSHRIYAIESHKVFRSKISVFLPSLISVREAVAERAPELSPPPSFAGINTNLRGPHSRHGWSYTLRTFHGTGIFQIKV